MGTIGVVIVALTIIVGAGAGGYIAYDAGYIPITDLMTVEKPLGYREINIENYEQQYKDVISQIPNIDNIKYQVFESDYNSFEIYSDYKNRLENQGYQEKVVGSKTINGINVKYYGFLKGITAVGIAIVSGADVGRGTESVILYTTGSALDYKEMIDYFNGLDGSNEILSSGVNDGGET